MRFTETGSEEQKGKEKFEQSKSSYIRLESTGATKAITTLPL
jgi:hypothetical protein